MRNSGPYTVDRDGASAAWQEAGGLFDARCSHLSPWLMRKDVLEHKPTVAPIQRAAASAAFDTSFR
jgi:hypothetical protein